MSIRAFKGKIQEDEESIKLQQDRKDFPSADVYAKSYDKSAGVVEERVL